MNIPWGLRFSVSSVVHKREAGKIRRGRREGPSRRSWAGEKQRAIASPTRAQGACWAPRPISCPPKPSPGCIAPWGHRREDREIRRGRQEGPSQTEEQERRGGRLPCPLKPRKPSGLPGEAPRPLRPGMRSNLRPFGSLSLSPTPHSPQGLFQPCGSWALAPPTAQNSPFLRPCPPQPRPSPPPFSFFLFFFFTIVVLLYLPVVDSSLFLFLYSSWHRLVS